MWSVYWSLKESLLKAVGSFWLVCSLNVLDALFEGCGLAFDLNTIDFSELLKPAPTSVSLREPLLDIIELTHRRTHR